MVGGFGRQGLNTTYSYCTVVLGYCAEHGGDYPGNAEAVRGRAERDVPAAPGYGVDTPAAGDKDGESDELRACQGAFYCECFVRRRFFGGEGRSRA